MDDLTGPFTDAIGAPLWREPYANDPSLFIDDGTIKPVERTEEGVKDFPLKTGK